MIETLAFVTVIITQGADGLPEGTVFETTDPVQCIRASEEILAYIEGIGGKADTFCEYTHAPATSIRPKARPTWSIN